MIKNKIFWLEVAMIATLLAVTAVMYPHLPARVPTHWDSRLEVNGYSPKWALFLLGPGVLAAICFFTFLGPWLSPKRFEVQNFQSTYSEMMLILFCVFVYCEGVMLWSGAGHRFDAGRAIQGGVCVLFVMLGNLMGKVRRNFFLGIRTPWTLASEPVWNGTHRLGAKTFVVAGIIAFAFTIANFHGWPVYVLLAGPLVPAAYSLILYKRLEASGGL